MNRSKNVREVFQKLGLLMIDINLGYAKYHSIILFIIALYAIKIYHAIQYMFRDMRILRVIEIIFKKLIIT